MPTSQCKRANVASSCVSARDRIMMKKLGDGRRTCREHLLRSRFGTQHGVRGRQCRVPRCPMTCWHIIAVSDMDALLSALRVRPCPRSINGAHAPILDPMRLHLHHPTPLGLLSSGRKPSMAVCTRDAHTSADGDSAVIHPLRFRHFLSSPHS